MPDSNCICGFSIHPISISLLHDCLLKFRIQIAFRRGVRERARVCVRVGARGCAPRVQGAFLFPYKDVRFYWAQPLKGRERRFFRVPALSSKSVTPAGWASVAIFRTFAKAWENYVNVARFPQCVEGRGRKRGGAAVRSKHDALHLTDVDICNFTQQKSKVL